MKKLINIEGMNCSHCIEKIEGALLSLPQVDEVSVSLENKNAEVTFISDIDNELLKNLIDNAGHFNVTSIENL